MAALIIMGMGTRGYGLTLIFSRVFHAIAVNLVQAFRAIDDIIAEVGSWNHLVRV